MFDFDKNFEEYLVEFYKTHEDEFENVEDMEDRLPQIYNEWADKPCPNLGDIAPRAFFDNIKSADELIELLITTSTGELNPCSLLLDRIASERNCHDLLVKIIKGTFSVKQKMFAINLLIEGDGKHPLELYVTWVKNPEIVDELKDIAIEVLLDNALTVQEQIYELLDDSCSFESLLCYADILVNGKKDERTFALLSSLLSKKEELAIVAGLIGKYGDERHAQGLYKALEGANYLQFIELKNSIERLGGIVDESDFDFDDDMYYKALKGTN